MAINIPIVTEFVDTGLKSAAGAFDTFKTKVGEAEGGMGKLKAGAGVAFDSIKANAGNLALGAGAAIAGFAAKAIGDFQDLALSVDEFANKTNLTLDQSSRWNAYTGDLGIESDAMVKVFDKLGKAAENQIPAFDELGVAIAFGPDGTTDIEETFLRVVDKLNEIKDPAARAKLQAELFGKGWMNAAEIINSSSSDIKAALKSVGDAEIIDQEEIDKAKELREAQDRLGDAFAAVSVKLGQALIPALTKVLDVLTPVLEAFQLMEGTLDKGLADAITKAQDMGKSLSDIARELGADSEQSLVYMADVLGISLKELYSQLDRDLIPETYFLKTAWEEGARAMIDARDDADLLEQSLIDVDTALSNLKGEVDDRTAWRNLQDEFDNTREAAVKAFTEGTPAAIRDSDQALDDLRVKVGEYIVDLDNIPEESKTKFLAEIPDADLARLEEMLAFIARTRTINFIPTVGGVPIRPGDTPSEVLGRRSFNPTAGTSVVVNVQGSVVAENDLVESVRKGLVNSQRNGSQLVYTNK